MSQTPFIHAESLRVGTVDFISPDEVKVLLNIEAPESVALNAGGVRPFPRVNGYVLLPVDDGYLVGQIEWLTIERSAFPKRRGVQDFGLVDLPYPLRKMSLNPIGTLRKKAGPVEAYTFRRGADALPSVGAAVFLPTEQQLRSIVESGERRRVRIGKSPLAADAEVSIDPDRLFGRHFAVLGNTGSGKSCSVAGIIRWSIEAAQSKLQSNDQQSSRPNARFIVLDPNGEYSRAFNNNDSGQKTRVFKINPEEGSFALHVPLWFWNSEEWCSFTQASAKTQRPLLKRALREVKAGRIGVEEPTEEEKKLSLRRYLSSTLISIQRDYNSGSIKTDENKFGFRLKAHLDDLENKKTLYPDNKLIEIQDAIEQALEATINEFQKNGKNIVYYRAFTESHVHPILKAIKVSLETLGGIIYQQGPDENVPLPFSGSDLADHLQILSEQENVSQFLDFLISRIRTFLSDAKINSVVGDCEEITLEGWLKDYIGGNEEVESPVAILDLSLVPTEVVHVLTAVTARMIFEALQRYRKLNGEVLPTVLVMEEAHTFIKRYKDDIENYDAATVCCQVFERIAREGRKFGLGLVLSSQRPSELSPTVLSQCNTFLLHRISNDRDQELVHRLVPDNLRGLLRELPSLPSQHAILLGWASELPVLVKMNDLPKHQQPYSDDPDFWAVWTKVDIKGNVVNRLADWKPIADDWQGKNATNTTDPSDGDGTSQEGDIEI
ncbi:MAG: ATP-binding protein [Desulfobulbaceae bacterium]|nr:MAG: ATP-binding protein [Desulfobulbaceae bacterium]